MPCLWRSLAAAWLLAASHLVCLQTQRAAAARDLAQAPAAAASGPPPGQSKYGSPRIDACIQLTNDAGEACSVESDTMSLVYPRGSEDPPTPEQRATAIENMKAAAQPSSACCEALLPYVTSRCPCDPDYQQLLPTGGFDAAYFEGATSILAEACGQSFPPCDPAGEVSQPLVPPQPDGGR